MLRAKTSILQCLPSEYDNVNYRLAGGLHGLFTDERPLWGKKSKGACHHILTFYSLTLNVRSALGVRDQDIHLLQLGDCVLRFVQLRSHLPAPVPARNHTLRRNASVRADHILA